MIVFANRIEAGKLLAARMTRYLGEQTFYGGDKEILVAGLPRGGVPVALEVARALACPMEIIVAKKLPFPGQPECAIGAVSSDGVVILEPNIPNEWQWRTYVEEKRRQLVKKTKAMEHYYYAGRRPSSFKNRIIVVVDDGVATGMTAIAALETARQRDAARIILATPVIGKSRYNYLRSYCDDVVTVEVSDNLLAVGQFYQDFAPTSSQEVLEAMRWSSGLPLRKYLAGRS